VIEHIGENPPPVKKPPNKSIDWRGIFLMLAFIIGAVLVCFIVGTMISTADRYKRAKQHSHAMALKACQAVNGQLVVFASGGDRICVAYPYRGPVHENTPSQR
jgi:hypothetical protein